MQNEVQISIKSKREVNYQFRILYAMLMFCVLAGHIGSVPEYVPWVELFSAYGFGIQLFLFISGYFYSKKKEPFWGSLNYERRQNACFLKIFMPILTPVLIRKLP